MSQENVEVVRRVIEANRSDDIEAGIETLVALSDPGAEFTSVVAAVEPETYRGHDGIRRYYRELADSWAEWHMEVEEVVDVGRDTVFVAFGTHLVGAHTGATVEAKRGGVFAFSEGKIMSAHIYPTRAEALEAVGLRE
jgi:ketosteroid isomerase-like protein